MEGSGIASRTAIPVALPSSLPNSNTKPPVGVSRRTGVSMLAFDPSNTMSSPEARNVNGPKFGC